MSPVDASLIFTGAPDQLVSGAILSAPEGTTVPTDVDTAPAAGFVSGGYVGPDGLRIGTNQNSTAITDWSGNEIRSLLDAYGHTLSYAHLELSEFALKDFFGDENVDWEPADATSGNRFAVRFNADDMPIKPRIFKMKDGPRRLRLVVPRAQLAERGEISFLKTAAVSLPISLKTFPDAAGNHAYLYGDDGRLIA